MAQRRRVPPHRHQRRHVRCGEPGRRPVRPRSPREGEHGDVHLRRARHVHVLLPAAQRHGRDRHGLVTTTKEPGMTTIKRRLAAGVLVLALTGAACGDDDNGDEAAPSATSDTTATTHSMSDDSNKDGYAKAYADVRTAYAHMWETGGVLSGAIAKQKGFADSGENKAAATRAVLSRLLGEHVLLAVVATTKG